jgi:hypothetical protein
MYKQKAELLICGDINTDYLIEINLGSGRTKEGGGEENKSSIIINTQSVAHSKLCNKHSI